MSKVTVVEGSSRNGKTGAHRSLLLKWAERCGQDTGSVLVEGADPKTTSPIVRVKSKVHVVEVWVKSEVFV